MIWETVIDKGQNLVVYGPAFLLTGLPIARGVEQLLDRLPWGGSAAAAPEPPTTPSVSPSPSRPALEAPHKSPDDYDPLEGW